MGFCTRDVVGKMGGPVLGDEGVVAPRELPERRIPQACLDVVLLSGIDLRSKLMHR